ncbi:MAG: putative DNA-binding domain-containing protein [Proteobacteria bacterium]|nr:putative DNA-binding domain-containing protein [Pseudomonadota bacterium]
MSRLSQIQDAFQRFLLTADSTIHSHVVGTQRVPVETRLAIYGDGYRSRLIEALQNSFPVLAELLGESEFQTMATGYVNAHESTFFNVRWYGDRLGDFLAADEEYSKAPILAEMARWEWAMAAAFDAADAEPIDIGAFAAVAPEDWAGLQFEWSPSVQVVAVEWNVPQLWKAVTEGGDRPEPAVAPARYVIWRRQLQIYFRALSEAEASVVAAARERHSFGELCVLLCEHFAESEASQHAAGFLRGWVESGLLVGVDSQTED